MSNDIQWSEWKVHTGGEFPLDGNLSWQAIGVEPEVWSIADFAKATPDSPITYRYEVKPKEVEPFALIFTSKGRLIATWIITLPEPQWKNLVINEAKTKGRMAVFYGSDGHPTGESHDFTEGQS